MNIQIDNLCQFLPQDRVNQFSKLPPHTRLLETERAAASPEMLENHKKLIKLDNELLAAKEGMNSDKESLKQLQTRQTALQQDVERLKERQEVQAKIAHLEKVLPYIKYRQSKEQTREAKKHWEDAKRELETLKTEMGPAMERPRRKKDYKDAVQAALRQRQEDLDEIERQLSRHKKNIIDRDSEIGEQHINITVEEKNEDKRKDEIKKLKKQVETMKKSVEEGPPEFDVTQFNDKIVRILLPNLRVTC